MGGGCVHECMMDVGACVRTVWEGHLHMSKGNAVLSIIPGVKRKIMRQIGRKAAYAM